jgi:hypothetical protein
MFSPKDAKMISTYITYSFVYKKKYTFLKSFVHKNLNIFYACMFKLYTMYRFKFKKITKQLYECIIKWKEYKNYETIF